MVEDSFFLHEIDALCIRSMLPYPCPPHIKLHISAANPDGTIPPSEILSSLEHDVILMEMAFKQWKTLFHGRGALL